jgi:NADH-quinone oxidoreductase subunit L
VLAAAAHATESGGGPAPIWVGWLVWITALFAVAITAWYATRLLLCAFFGVSREHGPDGPDWEIGFDDARYNRLITPHDPPGLMRWPILLLGIPAALLGLAAYAPGFRSALELENPDLGVAVVLPLILLVLGAGTAWWLWQAVPGVDPAVALGPARRVFANGFYLDNLQDRLVVRRTRALARVVLATDERVVDATVEGTGTTTSNLGGLLAAAHRIALPGAALVLLAGVLVLGVIAVGAAS